MKKTSVLPSVRRKEASLGSPEVTVKVGADAGPGAGLAPLEEGLATGEVGDPGFAGFPPRLGVVEVGAPLAHRDPGLVEIAPRLVDEAVENEAIYAMA